MSPDEQPRKARLFENLFDDLPADATDEQFARICELGEGSVRVERIVSRGHASPEDFWYDQEEDEWVLVLQGTARLTVEGHPGPVTLKPGDSLLLPARCRHRVDWTTPNGPTIWLAIFPQSTR